MRVSWSSGEPMSPRKRVIFLRIFPLIFIVVGASIGFFGIRGLIRAKASVDWPATQGKVIVSSVDYRSSDDGGAYHALIMYEYSVAGAVYNGNRVAYGDYGSSSSSHARRIVNRYPKGKSVTVHYMPGNPEECLLEPGLQGQSWFLPGFGLIFFMIGSLTAVFLPRHVRKQETTEHLA
jgi:hypothetical protein